MKTYLFSYPYKNGSYSFEIPADNEKEAKERAIALRNAVYDGELKIRIKIPVSPLIRAWSFVTGKTHT